MPGTNSEQPRALFNTGAIVATPNALGQLTQADITSALRRHLGGDWGELDEHGKRANDHALREGNRLLSSYLSKHGAEF